jgi:tyrosine-protein kinase Etk/Wzc
MDETVSLGLALGAIYRRRLFVLLCAALGLVLGLVYSLVQPNRYTAIGTVLPPADSDSGLGGLSSVGALAALSLGQGGHQSGELYVQLFKSRTVADRVIARFHLDQEYKTRKASGTRGVLAAKSRFDLSPSSGLITISVTDASPQRAADLVNGYVDAYRIASAHLAVTEAARRRAFFDQQLIEAKNNLASAEEKLAVTEQQTGLLQPEGQTQALISSAAALRAQVAAKQVEVDAMRNYATPENPQMQQAQAELTGLQAQLAALGRTEGDDRSALIMSKSAVEHGGVEYVRRLRDVKYYETIYETLARQLEAARLQEAREGSGIQVVDPAIAPDGKSGPKRTLITLGFLVAGGVLGCAWVLGQLGLEDYRMRRKALPPLVALRS